MARYVFDLESDGLLDTITTLHCLVLQDVDDEEVYSFGPNEIEQGLEMLSEADCIIGHNIIKYDLPAIQKVYPSFTYDEAKVIDTLTCTRLIWTNLSDKDQSIIASGVMAPRLRGSHSLKAWGYRLGLLKGEFSNESTDWSTWTPEMQEYCEQDVAVTLKLWKLIDSKNYSQQALDLEHKVAFIVAQQERHGFVFDVPAAERLLRTLQEERAVVEAELQTTFLPWYSPVEVTTPKRSVNYKDLTRHSVVQGAPYTKVKLNVFNAGSRRHIADRLIKMRGWQPTSFNADGSPTIDDEILSALPYPEAQLIGRYLMLQKRLGQLEEGKNSWLKLEVNGRIHGSVVTNGAVTGRMTHNYPNVAQVPSVGKPYGAECRALFTVPAGKKLVGVDVSGLELRMLGHFIARFDGGEYGREVVNGDIHSVNANAAGLSRSDAKVFVYAYLYGAGNAKIGSIVGKGPAAGAKLKAKFLDKTPALAKLIRTVQSAAERGYLRGLDGRLLHIRSKHAALNTLLQSAGAIVCKQWAVEMDEALKAKGWSDRVQVVANIHDEHQYESDAEIAEEVGKLSVECIKRAGEHFNIRVELDGEYNVGENWQNTH